MSLTSTFKKTFTLQLKPSSYKIELDRQDQHFTLFKGCEPATQYKRGQVLEGLLKEEGSTLNVEQFFLYHLDVEDNIDKRSLTSPAPSVCRCYFVTQDMVQDKFSQGLSALGLSESTGAGSLCGKCLPDLCRSFYTHQAAWKFDQQKVRTKKTPPADIVLYLGNEFPQIVVENFFENCLYYRIEDEPIDENQIKNAVWSKFKERIVTVAL